MKRILCAVLCLTVLLSGMSLPVAADTRAGGAIAGLEDKLQYSVALTDDGYIGIPVDIYTYHNGNTTDQTPIILYVINTNTERIGTDSDFTIVNEMVNEKGYIVVVLDYKGAAAAVSPDLDWSIQGIRTKINSYGMYLGGAAYKEKAAYIVPSGYNITLDEYYWSIDKHGADGVLDMIVNVWNNDFQSVYGNKTIQYSDGTTKKVSEVTASSIYDCVKPDGTPIDMDLRMDLIYPTHPQQEVPVMVLSESAESRGGGWVNALRPHMTGFLFNGYAGVIYDFAYVPMARNDHYGYFDGNSAPGHITGDNYTYSVHVYSGVKAETAAIRKIRYLADVQRDTYKFDLDKFGVYGNSKGGLCTRLGAKNPETLAESRYFEGHHGETRYENGDTEDDALGIIDGGEAQPWLTYSDGTPIPSNVQFVYANCGGGAETIREGHAPTYATGSMLDGSYYAFYPEVVNNCRIYEVPLLNFSCPELGHALGYGIDKDYGINVYDALFDYADYWLKGGAPQCEYIDIKGGTAEVPTNTEITLKFTGAISEEEIKKVTIQNDVTGEIADCARTASYGGTTWVLTCSGLQGGYAYTVHVPAGITAENGQPLKEAKSLRFETVHEQKEAATRIAGDSGMTLLKTESTDNGVYFVFDNADCSASTTAQLRFDVENDAANHVFVYAIDALDELDITNSTQGELLGEITLTGAGSYQLDVTEYVKSLGDEKPAFVLRAKNVSETKVISDYNFEPEGAGSDGLTGVNFGKFVSAAASAEQNHTAGGSRSVKFDYMTKNDNAYFAWMPFDTIVSFPNLIKSSALDASDLGRKFHISMSIYDTTSREVKAELTKTSSRFGEPDNIDWNATRRNIMTEANKWNTYSLVYRVDNPIYWNSLDKRALSITAEPTGQTDNYHPMYLDDVTVTEEITEVKVLAPSLILHPAETVLQSPQNAAYVESGPKAGESFAGSETLLVNGSCPSVSIGNYKKVYARFPLGSFSGAQGAKVTVNITNDHDGELYVYGVADPVQTAAWNAGTINYMNAPANDRFGFGADTSKVYGGGPIAVIHVSGMGSHTIDVTEYASSIQDLGGAYGTLIFAMKSESDEQTVKLTENFDNGSAAFAVQQGGDIISHGISSDEDHTTGGGSSYMMNTAFGYDRLKFDLLDCASLSASDIGKRFTVTYWLKSDKTGSFFNSLLFKRGANDNLQIKTQHYTTANEWQQFTYSFTLTDNEIPDNATPDNISSWINFNLDKMGARASGGTDIVCAYIDDITVTGNVVGDVAFDIAPAEEAAPSYEKTIAFDGLNSWRAVNDFYTEVNSKADLCFGGGNAATLKGELVGPEVTADHTTGGGKSLWLCMPVTHARFKFYNLFDHNLTEADLGRTFEVSFWAKRDALQNENVNHGFRMGLMSVGSGSDYTTKFYESAANKNLLRNLTTEWTQHTYTITVEEAMLASSYTNDYYNPALFSITAFEYNTTAEPINMYIDDLTVKETTEKEAPYRYSCDWEAEQTIGNTAEDAVNTGGFDRTNRVVVSSEENCTAGEGKNKSLKFVVDGNGYRMFFNKIVGTGSLTDADVGKNYRVGFWMKADKAGSFQLSMTNTSLAATKQPPTYPEEKIQTYTVTADDIGKWKKYTYDFTVTQGMVTAGANQFFLRPTGYGANNTATLYIDDITSVQRIGGSDVGLGCDQSAVISNRPLSSTEGLSVSRSGAPAYIRKVYLHYAGGENRHTQKAELTLRVADADKQTLNVFGITGLAYPDILTYHTAPGSNADESMDTNAVFGGKPIAQIQLSGAGTYSVDVTDYVKNNAPNDSIFAFTSDASGGVEYTKLDFETFGFSEGVDYVPYGGYAGTVNITDGAARVDGIAGEGEGIKLLNLFGSGGAFCKAGETYTISADVTPYGSENSYEITMGLCGADAASVSSEASTYETIAAGSTQKVSFTFTANAQHEADGVCALAVYASSLLPASGFTIDNVSVSSSNSIQIAADATLQIEKAQEPERVQTCSMEVSATGSGRILYNVGTEDEENLSSGATKRLSQGSEVSLTAQPADGAAFLYWIQTDTGRIVSEKAAYNFVIGSDTNLTAIFTDNESGKLVVFKNGRSQQIVTSQFTAGSAVVPAAPYVMGYEFTGWLKNGIIQSMKEGDAVEVSGHTVFSSEYTRSNETYEVVVEHGSGSGIYRYNDMVTAAAAQAEPGKKFSHWERGGTVVSYAEKYSFYVNGNTTVSAVYVAETEAVTKRPILVMSTPVAIAEENKIAFFAERDLPEQYALVETGILLGTRADLTLHAAGVLKTVSITGKNKGQFTVRKGNVAAGEIWYGRAYMIYKDNGIVKTIYSDVVSGALQ